MSKLKLILWIVLLVMIAVATYLIFPQPRKQNSQPSDPNWPFNQAWYWDGRNAFEKAMDYCASEVQRNPDDVQTLIFCGGWYMNNNNVVAMNDLNRAISLNPRIATAYFFRGWIYNKLGQHRKAIDDYNKAIGLYPNEGESYMNRAWLYYSLAQHQKAIDDFSKAIVLYSNEANSYYINRGWLSGNSVLYERAIDDFCKRINFYFTSSDQLPWSQYRQSEISAYFDRGWLYYHMGRYKKALEDFNNLIAFDTMNEGAHSYRGVIYDCLGRYQQAIEECTKIINMRSYVNAQSQAYGGRGYAYFRLGQYDRAVDDYSRAIEEWRDVFEENKKFGKILNPELGLVYHLRAQAYEKLGKKDLAAQDNEMANRLSCPVVLDFYGAPNDVDSVMPLNIIKVEPTCIRNLGYR